MNRIIFLNSVNPCVANRPRGKNSRALFAVTFLSEEIAYDRNFYDRAQINSLHDSIDFLTSAGITSY